MNNTKRIIIAVVAVVIVAGGIIWYVAASSKQAAAPAGMAGMSEADHQAMSHSDNSNDSNKPITSTITYNGSSFSLSTDKVASGSAVKIVNNSQSPLDFDSDPHPTHTDNPELNQGDVAPSESKTFTLTTKGTWGFHNHHDPTQHGNITVE